MFGSVRSVAPIVRHDLALSITTFRVDGVDARDLQNALWKERIRVRALGDDTGVRLSVPGPAFTARRRHVRARRLCAPGWFHQDRVLGAQAHGPVRQRRRSRTEGIPP
jgi:hypothetical protein